MTLRRIWCDYPEVIKVRAYLVIDVLLKVCANDGFIAVCSLSKLAKLLRRHAHNSITEFAGELNEEAARKVGDISAEHVSGSHRHVGLCAVLAPVACRFLLHLLVAVGARIVHHLIVGLHSLHEPAHLKEPRLLRVNVGFFLERLLHLLDKFEVVGPHDAVSGLPLLSDGLVLLGTCFPP